MNELNRIIQYSPDYRTPGVGTGVGTPVTVLQKSEN